MSLHWIGAPGPRCQEMRLDGGTYLTGTPVFPAAEQPGTAQIMEIFEETIRRKVFWTETRSTAVIVSEPDLDTQDEKGFFRPSEPWFLPGPIGPKGNRAFCFDFYAHDSAGMPGAARQSPMIQSSGLGVYDWQAHEQNPTATFTAGVPLPVGTISASGSYESNAYSLSHGTFTAAIDPDISVKLLTPGQGLEEYLADHVTTVGHALGLDVDSETAAASIVSPADRMLAEAVDLQINPILFHVEAGGWRDIVVRTEGPRGVSFPAAIRFTAEELGISFVTDLVTLTTSASAEWTTSFTRTNLWMPSYMERFGIMLPPDKVLPRDIRFLRDQPNEDGS